MSWSSRRAVLALAAVTLLGTLSLVGFVYGQKRPRPPIKPAPGGGPVVPGGKPTKDNFDLGPLTLPKDDDLEPRVQAATDNIKNATRLEREGKRDEAVRVWERACATLQDLVQRPKDVFVPLTRTDGAGREANVYVSVKTEAMRLIGSMPDKGRKIYEAKYGPGAKKSVDQAKENNDPLLMSDTFARFLYTEAGAEAGAWMGTYCLDRAEYDAASRFYQQLVMRSKGTYAGLNDKTLIKAAYAFNAANDKANREKVMVALQRRGAEFKPSAEAEPRTVADLRADLDKMVVSAALQSASDSLVYRGGYGRSAVLVGGTPFLEPSWRMPMASTRKAKEYLRLAEDGIRSHAGIVMSANVPITVTTTKDGKQVSQLIFRTWGSIQGVDMKTGAAIWHTNPANISLDDVFDEKSTATHRAAAYEQWLRTYSTASSGPNFRPQMLLENSVLGTLSSDGKNVFGIEDVPVPAPAQQAFPGNPAATQKEVADALSHNKLVAYNLRREGYVMWEVGGTDRKDPLGESYFLSAPLPLNGKLYVLNEKEQELRLVCLAAATGKVLGIQPLATIKNVKMITDPLRRTQACHPAYGEGIMVVPTNAGAVFGVDTVSNALLWAYPYRDSASAPPVPPGGGLPGRGFPPFGGMVGVGSMKSEWQVTAPVVSGGKVVFAAPDGSSLHCVSIRDGSRIWHVSRSVETEDLYLGGVFADKVVVVGRKGTRALSLANGKQLWKVIHNEPSGQGAASPSAGGDILYYLPIRANAAKEPEILSINVDKGLVHAHTRSRKKEVPGNLIFFEGKVISQNQHEVVAYPQLELQIARLGKELAEKPGDAALLAERGDYLLDKGDLDKAIADLRGSLAKGPAAQTKAKARAKLYEAFTQLFQRDFAKAERYIDEFEEVCKVDLAGLVGADRTARIAEGRSRRANFLCLVGKGREAQNRLVDAFKRYLELGEEALPNELIVVVDEPSVKAAPDVWSQGRIEAMVKRATDAKQKTALEALIKGRWQSVKGKGSRIADLRRFVSLFGSLFGVGREARFALADKLMEDSDLNSLLEAEQQLSVLRSSDDETVAARAVEALARLNTRKGLLEDAAYYYRVLGEKYPDVKVDGKAGKQHFEDLATDKRFLPYLSGAERFVIRAPAELHSKEKQESHPASYSYALENLSEPLPWFVRHKLAVKSAWPAKLEILDTSTGVRKFRDLPTTAFNTVVSLASSSPKARFGYQTMGHAVVLQQGHRVFGIDPLGNEPRILWSRNLSPQLPSTEAGLPTMARSEIDARDGSVVMVYSDGSAQRMPSGSGPLAGGVVCLLRKDSMTAIDPVTGRELWVRTDVSSRSQVFGDGQNVYVVGLNDKGDAGGTRAFRAYDGVSVDINDFSHEFDGRQRVLGRMIYTKHKPPGGATTVKLYDIVQGKSVWTEKFPPGAVVLDSINPDLAGAVDAATGTVRIVSLKSRKEIMTAKLDDPKDALGAESAVLVADPEYVFVGFKKPNDPNAVTGAVASCLQPNMGLTAAPVNGKFYAFRRSDAERIWVYQIDNAYVTLTGAEDAPALHFTSSFNQRVGGPGFGTMPQVRMAFSRAKHNGKMWWMNDRLPSGTTFHEYEADQRTGKMELIADQLKVTLTSKPK